MKNKIKIIGIVSFIAIAACSQSNQPKVCFEKVCFNVEKADTPEKRAKGLMFRKELGENRGMFFIFNDEKKQGFWMKNMSIPLDIIWIDKNKKVVFIKERVKPCTSESCPIIYPSRKSKYVLEINAGQVSEKKIKIGEYIY